MIEILKEKLGWKYWVGFLLWDMSMWLVLIVMYVGLNSIDEKMPVSPPWIDIAVGGLSLVSYLLLAFLAWLVLEGFVQVGKVVWSWRAKSYS